MISLFLLLVLGITAGLFYREGLWSALVAVINVLFAAAVATAWYEWPAALISGAVPSAGYLADFFCVWVLFALLLAGTSELTNRVSRTRVKFPPLVDRIGGPAVGLVVGWIFICFTATTPPRSRSPRPDPAHARSAALCRSCPRSQVAPLHPYRQPAGALWPSR
jgi:hypothetical protein